MSVLFSTGLSKFISGEQLHSQGTLEAGGFNLPPPLPPAPQHPSTPQVGTNHSARLP